MTRRRFRPEDAYRLKAASDPQLSPDGRRVAFVLGEVDEEQDRLVSAVFLAAVDGSAPPRRFSEGPADRSPRFSPDGRYLAYVSVTDDQPHHAHVRLAHLEGGAPARLGDLPGPVSQLAWSPDSRRLVVVCRVGAPDPDSSSARERNAARTVRGLAARLDGVGWQDGRRHLFLIDVAEGSATQLTHGEFDHSHPAFSPDGDLIAFTSDRHPRRDDRQFRSDVWVIPASGKGRPSRLTAGTGECAFPMFSPDGGTIAYAGRQSDSWDEESHVYVVPTGGGEPQRVAPATDRGVVLFPGLPAPMCWIGRQELAMLLADRGAISLHRARLGEASSRELLGGDIQIDGLAGRVGGRTIAFSASWPDRPSELYAVALGGGEPTRLTQLNDALLDEVELAAVERSSLTRPDGSEIEYFTLLPPGSSQRRFPLHLDIHGGPHGAWPSGRGSATHQAIAGAGYAVLLPNPRGSTSYGQAFTAACTGDWGGGDCEDILACCDDLVRRGIADERRMFVSGASYGGFMTSWIVGHSRRFRAATAVAACTDLRNQLLLADIPDFARFSMGGLAWERPDEYEKRSPVTYLPEVVTPVLVVHWEGDLRVPIAEGEELYAGLRLLGKEAEMVRYPGGFHISRTPSQGVDWARRTIEWDVRHDLGASRRRGARQTPT